MAIADDNEYPPQIDNFAAQGLRRPWHHFPPTLGMLSVIPPFAVAFLFTQLALQPRLVAAVPAGYRLPPLHGAGQEPLVRSRDEIAVTTRRVLADRGHQFYPTHFAEAHTWSTLSDLHDGRKTRAPGGEYFVLYCR